MHDLLLPLDIKQFNSRKNHFTMSTLIIDSIYYVDVILKTYLQVNFNFRWEKCVCLVKYFVGNAVVGEKWQKNCDFFQEEVFSGKLVKPKVFVGRL